jgi:hypothetical protein
MGNIVGVTFLAAREAHVPRTVRDVVFVDGVRTPFGLAKAGKPARSG